MMSQGWLVVYTDERGFTGEGLDTSSLNARILALEAWSLVAAPGQHTVTEDVYEVEVCDGYPWRHFGGRCACGEAHGHEGEIRRAPDSASVLRLTSTLSLPGPEESP